MSINITFRQWCDSVSAAAYRIGESERYIPSHNTIEQNTRSEHWDLTPNCCCIAAIVQKKCHTNSHYCHTRAMQTYWLKYAYLFVSTYAVVRPCTGHSANSHPHCISPSIHCIPLHPSETFPPMTPCRTLWECTRE